MCITSQLCSSPTCCMLLLSLSLRVSRLPCSSSSSSSSWAIFPSRRRLSSLFMDLQTQAGIAQTQAGIAQTQAGIAQTQDGIAQTQAGIAQTTHRSTYSTLTSDITTALSSLKLITFCLPVSENYSCDVKIIFLLTFQSCWSARRPSHLSRSQPVCVPSLQRPAPTGTVRPHAGQLDINHWLYFSLRFISRGFTTAPT